jgi:UDP-N-acetylmuramate--alanine ligase
VDELIILPVWSAGEERVKIDFKKYFARYNPIFADKIKTNRKNIKLIKDNKIIKEIDNGLVIGFGAGDITYQLRGII